MFWLEFTGAQCFGWGNKPESLLYVLQVKIKSTPERTAIYVFKIGGLPVRGTGVERFHLEFKRKPWFD